jgi:hypothetical protein
MNWSSVLTASSGVVNGPLTASANGNDFTLTSNDQFEGVDNTALAWNGAIWAPAGFVTTDSTFAGHFNSSTTPSGPFPEPTFGDNLLGVLTPNGDSTGNPQLTLSFAQTINYIQFQVTARTGIQGTDPITGENTNFTATLVAYDSSGNVIGTYQVADQGTGGTCAGLSNGSGPQPCNDAPFVQFYDPLDRIKSVQLSMDDPTGLFIDTLRVGGIPRPPPLVEGSVPEPSSFVMFGVGMLALLWAAKRGKFTW